MRRYTRLINPFSKKMENHAAHVALHFFNYNTILSQAPNDRDHAAVAAAVAEHLMNLGGHVRMMDAATPKPSQDLPEAQFRVLKRGLYVTIRVTTFYIGSG